MKQLVETNSFIIAGQPALSGQQRPNIRGQHAGRCVVDPQAGSVPFGRCNVPASERTSRCADRANQRTSTRSSRSTLNGHNESVERRMMNANMDRVNKRINKTPINEKINEKVIKTAYPNIRDQNKLLDDVPSNISSLVPGHVLGNMLGSIKIDYFPRLQCFIFVSLISQTVVRQRVAFVNALQRRLGVQLSISELLASRRKPHSSKPQRPVHRTSRRWLSILTRLLIIFNGLLTCTAIKNQYNKAVGAVPGDLVLGALFPVHHAPGPGN